jgi:hypothetical protein
MFYPSDSPVSVEQLDLIDRAYRAKVLTDKEMLRKQDELYPRCVDHPDQPAKWKLSGYYRCEACYLAQRKQIPT